MLGKVLEAEERDSAAATLRDRYHPASWPAPLAQNSVDSVARWRGTLFNISVEE
jgi:hypothetical protein